jgi:ParB family transcriptional regulator, chromosome partitioning protein
MGKSSVDTYGASGQSKVLHFKPEDLVLVKSEKSALYDDRVEQPLSEEFIANIDYFGVVEPIVVRKNTEDGRNEVVAGRQRVRAALEVNKRRKKRGDKLMLVPATIKRGDDALMMGIMASENEARVANTPMQRALLIQRMLNHGMDEKSVAMAMNTSIATVKNLLALMEAPAAVRNAVQNGKVSAAVGYKLARLPAAEAKAKLAEATTTAPKERGRRTGAAKKQMEVVTGVKATTLPKSRADVESMKDLIEENDDLAGEIKRVMIAVCDWMLGSDQDLREICGMEEVEEEAEEEEEEEEAEEEEEEEEEAAGE